MNNLWSRQGRSLSPNKLMLDLQKRLRIFTALWIFKRLLRSNVSRSARRNMVWMKRRGRPEGALDPGALRSWTTPQASSRAAEWRVCALFVWVWNANEAPSHVRTPDQILPRAHSAEVCNTLGRGWCGESFPESETGRSQQKKASVGKFRSANLGKEREGAAG